MDVINEMSNLVASIEVKGKQEFMGKEIPVVEGGFGEGQKVVLAKTIAEIHGMELREVNQLINNNIDEFDFGIDILDLKNTKYFNIITNDLEIYRINISIFRTRVSHFATPLSSLSKSNISIFRTVLSHR